MTTATTRTRPGAWLARPRRVENPALRLICFPHVGAGGAAFTSWLDHLPAGVELCAIRLPGRENRLHEPLVDDWRTLLDDLVPAVEPLLDVPYVLAGHCSGSVLAWECARRLVAASGPDPRLVVLTSTPAPAVRDTTDPLHLLPSRELLERVVGFGGMPGEILDDPELMAMVERILRADYRVVERLEYSAGGPLPVPVTVLGGRHDDFASSADLAAWSAETTAGFTLHLLDAGHYILTEAGAVVADTVRRLLPGEAS